jgi:hypothetical protein
VSGRIIISRHFISQISCQNQFSNIQGDFCRFAGDLKLPNGKAKQPNLISIGWAVLHVMLECFPASPVD